MTRAVAQAHGGAHLAAMLKRRDMPQPEATPPVQPAAERSPLRSNPPKVQLEWAAILDEIERDFPITLARLAE